MEVMAVITGLDGAVTEVMAAITGLDGAVTEDMAAITGSLLSYGQNYCFPAPAAVLCKWKPVISAITSSP